MSDIRATARAIVIKDGKILLMERHRKDAATGKMLHYFSIPGGGIEDDEMPEKTVVRELYEEMSIVVRPKRLLGESQNPSGKKHKFYLCEYRSGEAMLNPDSPEARRASVDNQFSPVWVDLADAAKIADIHPDYRQVQIALRRITK